MQTYHESRVEAADIDNLGHMNVRIYAQKAAHAVKALAAEIGLGQNTLEQAGSVIHTSDTHTRFYKEQLEGAPLEVRGGVISAEAEGIAVYLELINPETGDRAATFRNVFQLRGGESRAPRAIDQEILARAHALGVDWPEHGRPRSLPLGPVRGDVMLGDMDARGIGSRFDAYTVAPEQCDAYGYMDVSDGLSLSFAGMPIKLGPKHRGFRTPDGKPVSIATVEQRYFIFDLPRAGDSVANYTVNVGIGDKLIDFRHWSFDEGTGKPLSVMAQVGLNFDIQTRRTMDFSPAMRAEIEANLHPELG